MDEGRFGSELFGVQKIQKVWQAIGEESACSGEFSIIQTGDAPDRLTIQCDNDYDLELSRQEVERLIRNLRAWLDHGEETLPGTCAGSEGCDLDMTEDEIAEAVRRSAEECDVEKVVFDETGFCDANVCMNFYVLRGREITYNDMVRFIDGCGRIPDYVNFYSAEFSNELDRFNESDRGTVYVKRRSD